MRKILRVFIVIFIAGGIIVTYCYYKVPAVKEFIEANTALLTFLGFLIGIPSLIYLFYLLLSKKDNIEMVTTEEKISTEKEEIPEEKVEAILSPVAGLCIGREKELSTLEDDLTHRNILLIKGIAGIGKTTLGRTFKDKLDKKGYETFWSHIGYNSYEGFLFELSQYLKERGSKYAGYISQEADPEKRFKFVVQELCKYPTVVFLDDFQKLKDDSAFAIFKDFLQNSTLVIMSRVQPTFLLEDYKNLSYLRKQASVTLLKQLGLKESDAVLEKIFLKTQGHPWSLERFVRFSYKLPVKKLFAEIPDFREEQEDYINEQCWNTLKMGEKDFLMRASVFTKPLDFDGLQVCSKNLSTVLVSLADNFYITKREEYYYIHDIIRDFAFLQLKKVEDLYGEAHRKAAGYYRENVSAENLLLGHYHLKEAGKYREGIELIVYNIEYFWREGFWSDVGEVLEESLEFFDDDLVIAGICNSLGTIVYMLGEWDKALECHKKDLEISEGLDDVTGIATAYGNLGSVYYIKGEWDKALEYYKKDLEISEGLDDMAGMARAYCGLGLVYHVKGEWDKALECHKKHLEISERLNNMAGIATAYGNLGLVYHVKGEWDRALKYYKKDLEISEGLNDVAGIATAYGNLGLVYHDKNLWDKALECHKKHLEISERLNDVAGIARAYCNHGVVYRVKGEWDKALEYYKKHLEISERLNDVAGIARAYGNIGEAYCKKGEFDTAMEYCEMSLEISKELGDIYNMAYIYRNTGDISLAKKELNQAFNWYQKALIIFEKLGANHEIKITKEKIADTLKFLNSK